MEFNSKSSKNECDREPESLLRDSRATNNLLDSDHERKIVGFESSFNKYQSQQYVMLFRLWIDWKQSNLHDRGQKQLYHVCKQREEHFREGESKRFKNNNIAQFKLRGKNTMIINIIVLTSVIFR